MDEKARGENGDEVDGLDALEHDHGHGHSHEHGHGHSHEHFDDGDNNEDANGMTELLSMQVEAYMDTE